MDRAMRVSLRHRMRAQGCEDYHHAKRILSALMAERSAFTRVEAIYDAVLRCPPVDTRNPDAQSRAIREDADWMRLSDGIVHVVKCTYPDGTIIYRKPSEFYAEREHMPKVVKATESYAAKAASLAKFGTQADID